MRRDVFQAIADPTRREIINLIAHKSLNLNSVAENFDVSRPAISRHIKILMECGLLEIKQQGRERYCEAKLEKLNEVSDWVEQYRQLWEQKLDALESYLKLLQVTAKPVKSVLRPFDPSTSSGGTKLRVNQAQSPGKSLKSVKRVKSPKKKRKD